MDDGKTPKLWYSGWEDEIGGGHAFSHMEAHEGPFFGWYAVHQPRREHMTAYRTGFSDNHYFMRNYIYGIQGHARGDSAQHLDYTFQWYAAPSPTLLLTDELDLSEDSSLTNHTYQAEPATPFVNLTSEMHGQWHFYSEVRRGCPGDETRFTKRGTVMKSGNVSFTARFTPDNSGVILRRMIDLFYRPQRARVYVDQELVGVWMNSDNAPEYAAIRFADNTDFLIPAKFTYGKEQALISLEVEDRSPAYFTSKRIDYKHMQGFGWTAFHYWVYCIKLPNEGEEEPSAQARKIFAPRRTLRAHPPKV